MGLCWGKLRPFGIWPAAMRAGRLDRHRLVAEIAGLDLRLGLLADGDITTSNMDTTGDITADPNIG